MDTVEGNRAFAKSFFGNNDDGSLHPDDADWTEERVPLSSLLVVMGEAEDWKAWFREEVEMRKADLAPENEPGFTIGWEEFAVREIDEPCVIAFDENGTPTIWDGFHRIAGAFVREALDIPAVVGRRKPGLSPRPF